MRLLVLYIIKHSDFLLSDKIICSNSCFALADPAKTDNSWSKFLFINIFPNPYIDLFSALFNSIHIGISQPYCLIFSADQNQP